MRGESMNIMLHDARSRMFFLPRRAPVRAQYGDLSSFRGLACQNPSYRLIGDMLIV